MLSVEVGQEYRTRADKWVKIRAVDDDGMYFGDIVDCYGAVERIASFSQSGQYIKGRETEFDIVASWYQLVMMEAEVA